MLAPPPLAVTLPVPEIAAPHITMTVPPVPVSIVPLLGAVDGLPTPLPSG
jgi:hypothetical protein